MRYLVSFWKDYVFLGYVSVMAASEAEADTKARGLRKHRGWDNLSYTTTIEQV